MNNPVKYPKKFPISCCYTNRTKSPKIIRMADADCRYLEKVVLPNTKIYFQAQPESFLEVHGNDMISSILEARIRCSYLQVESVGFSTG
jgi:hypothetical protein